LIHFYKRQTRLSLDNKQQQTLSYNRQQDV